MASVEAQLQRDEAASTLNLEVEITAKHVLPHGRHDSGAVPLSSTTTNTNNANNAKPPRKFYTPKKPAKQTMGQCKKCGYLSSQDTCKACVLLEGLNKARPKSKIEVGYDGRDDGVHGAAEALERSRLQGA